MLGLTYFYPGYFVPGYAYFDYKLSIGKNALEFLQLSSSQWLPIQKFSPDSIPIKVMEEKLMLLHKLLTENSITSSVVKYEYFDANLVPELSGAELFDFPVMLVCRIPSKEGENPIVVFDVRDGYYHLLNCMAVWLTGNGNEEPGFYSANVLKTKEEIFFSPGAAEMLENILG
jgi:arginine-tRNA-protein transferase